MSDTVYGQLEDTKTALARKLVQNNEICGVLAALLGRVVIACQQKGISISDVHMGALRTTGDGTFMSRIDYNYRGLMVPPGLGEKGTFEDYLAHKGVELAKVLALNNSMSVLFESLVGRIEQYASQKSVDFKDLWVYHEGAFISKDDELVIKVGHGLKPYKLRETR